MDSVQDNAPAQEPPATITVLCVRSIQSRALSVIAEPGETRVIDASQERDFLATGCFQVIPTVTAAAPDEPADESAKPARRKKAE